MMMHGLTNVKCTNIVTTLFKTHSSDNSGRRRYSDSLQAGRSGDRIAVGARYSAHVQTGPGANPASYTVGTGSFPGVKRPGRGDDHPPHLEPRLKKE